MNASKFCLALAAIVLIACKKTKTATPQAPALLTTDIAGGLPDDASAINGYFYSCYNNITGSGYLNTYCAFRDPAANIISTYSHYEDNEFFTINSNGNFGNIRVGPVNFNALSLVENNTSVRISYRNSNSNSNSFFSNIPGTAWQTGGNGTFKPVNLNVPKGFPVFTYPIPYYTASLSQGFSLNLPPLVSNFDSLVAFLGASGFVGGNGLRKATTGNSTTLNFTQGELQSLGVSPGNSVGLSVYAYNYSNKTIENKVYVFELSNKAATYLMLNP